MAGLVVAALLGLSLFIVHFSLRARPMPKDYPLNVDEGLPLPELAQSSTVFSLTVNDSQSNGLRMLGAVTATGGITSTFTLAGTSTSANNVVLGNISENIGSTLSLVKAGGGIWAVKVKVTAQIPEEPGDQRAASLRYVTPGFFRAMQIPLHAGRDISESDTLERIA